MPFDRNVFINTPFDTRYQPLFNAIVFTIQLAGFEPRCALEASNAGQFRLERIMSIISECRYGLHDLSRTQLSREGLPRFNMPLELGLDLGCRRFGTARQRDKRLLVMDVKRYRYQKFISDIAGQDIEAHGNRVNIVIQRVRDWLRTGSGDERIPGAAHLRDRYQRFRQSMPRVCRTSHLTPSELTFADRCKVALLWLQQAER